LDAVARRSGGHLRDAESLLGQNFSLGDKKISLEQAELVIPHYNSNEAVDLLDYLSRKDAAKAISLVNGLVDTGVNLKNFSSELVGLLRKIMLNKINPSLTDNLGLNLGESLEIKVNAISNVLSWNQIIYFTRRFLEAYNDNKNSLISQLPLELAIVDLCFSEQTIASQTVSRNFTPGSPASSGTNTYKKEIERPKNEVAQKENEGLKTSVPMGGEYKGVVINLDTAAVMEKWPEFLIKIKKYNHSLSFVLQNCLPQDIKQNCLCLVFKYKFHQDRVNDATIRNIIETTLAEVFGANLSLSSVIDENLEIRHEAQVESIAPVSAEAADDNTKNGGSISDLLKTFGGEVIN
jgi:DNA polymerase III gamma/tau subunit